MIHRDRRDDTRKRALDNVGGIKPPAQADFKQQIVRRMLRKQHEGCRRLDLEQRDRRVAIGALAFGERIGKLSVGYQHAAAAQAKPEALVDAHQVGRGVDVHASSRCLQHGAQECDRRTLAIGAGHMDDRRHALLGMAEPRQHAAHALERQIDALGMQREQPLQNRIDGSHDARGVIPPRRRSAVMLRPAPPWATLRGAEPW